MLEPTQVQMPVPTLVPEQMLMPEQAQTQTRVRLGVMTQMEARALAVTRLEATVPTAVRVKALLPARAHPGAARALVRWRVRRRMTGRSATSRFGRARTTRV